MPNCSAVDPATMMPLFPTTNCNNASHDVGTFLLCILGQPTRLTPHSLTVALFFFFVLLRSLESSGALQPSGLSVPAPIQ
jgi:hypothetical protein